MNGFLSIGECMVEMAPAEGGQFRMGYAGDTFNTAWYAARMLPDDWRVGYASAVGDDAVSAAMCDFIAAQGVDTAHIRRLNGKTVGLYMIQLQNGERSFSYWRGQSAARHLADDAPWLDAAFQGQKMLFFSGITLAILPPTARDTLCAALARARANGAHVAFDTNLRPRLWDSADAMRHGLMQGAAVADTILPSFDEEQLAFGDSDPAQTDNARTFAADLTVQRHFALFAPLARPHPMIAKHHAPRLRQHQPHGQIGHIIGQNIGRIGHANAAFAGGSHINRVISHTIIRDHAKVGKQVHFRPAKGFMPLIGHGANTLTGGAVRRRHFIRAVDRMRRIGPQQAFAFRR